MIVDDKEAGVVTVSGDELKKLQAHARGELEKMRPPDGTPAVAQERTPYAVICPEHGQKFMTHDEYMRQMCAPDSRWACPDCGRVSQFDDDNYESAFEEPEE